MSNTPPCGEESKNEEYFLCILLNIICNLYSFLQLSYYMLLRQMIMADLFFLNIKRKFYHIYADIVDLAAK